MRGLLEGRVFHSFIILCLLQRLALGSGPINVYTMWNKRGLEEKSSRKNCDAVGACTSNPSCWRGLSGRTLELCLGNVVRPCLSPPKRVLVNLLPYVTLGLSPYVLNVTGLGKACLYEIWVVFLFFWFCFLNRYLNLKQDCSLAGCRLCI